MSLGRQPGGLNTSASHQVSFASPLIASFLGLLHSSPFLLFFSSPIQQELLGFYRQKIAEFDGEHADMLAKLERYKVTFADQV